jgi:hypothetical protein
MAIEPAAGIACEQLEQIHASRDRFRYQFPLATFTSRGRVEQPFEGASDHPDTAQFDRLRDVGDRLKRTGNSSVHVKEIDGRVR